MAKHLTREERCETDFKLIKSAKEQVADAKKATDPTERATKLRKASGEAWAGLVGVLDDAFETRHLGPNSHSDREAELVERDDESLVKYLKVKQLLHSKCYYEGVCYAPETVEKLVEDAESAMKKYRKWC
jgi:hypothetical protein